MTDVTTIFSSNIVVYFALFLALLACLNAVIVIRKRSSLPTQNTGSGSRPVLEVNTSLASIRWMVPLAAVSAAFSIAVIPISLVVLFEWSQNGKEIFKSSDQLTDIVRSVSLLKENVAAIESSAIEARGITSTIEHISASIDDLKSAIDNIRSNRQPAVYNAYWDGLKKLLEHNTSNKNPGGGDVKIVYAPAASSGFNWASSEALKSILGTNGVTIVGWDDPGWRARGIDVPGLEAGLKEQKFTDEQIKTVKDIVTKSSNYMNLGDLNYLGASVGNK